MSRLDHVVLLLAPSAVLWTEERADSKIRVEQGIGREAELAGHRRRMQDQPQRQAAKMISFTPQNTLEAGPTARRTHEPEPGASRTTRVRSLRIITGGRR